MEAIVKVQQPLVIVAEDVEQDALATLVVNKIREALTCVAVKAPGFGDRRKAMTQDIPILTGGQFIAEELGLKLENVGFEVLGKAKRVIVDKDNRTIMGGGGSKEAIAGRSAEIRKLIADTTSEYALQFLWGLLLGYQIALILSRVYCWELFRIPVVVSRASYGLCILSIAVSAAASASIVRYRIGRMHLLSVIKTRECRHASRSELVILSDRGRCFGLFCLFGVST